MAVAIGDVLRITARMSFVDLGLILNVYHVKVLEDGIPDDEDFQDAITAHLDLAYSQFNALMDDHIAYVDIEMYNLTQDIPLTPQPWPTLVSGVSVGTCVPLQAAALVTFPTAGKRSVGRKYLSGLSDSALDEGGKMNQTTVNAIADYGLTIVAGTAVGNAEIYFGNYRPATNEFYRWDGVRVRSYLRTQRRRVVGIGV